MNPDQIEALYQDFMSRSAEAVRSGDQARADIYEVCALVVRTHEDAARREAAADPAAVARYYREEGKKARRADALGLRPSVRVPL